MKKTTIIALTIAFIFAIALIGEANAISATPPENAKNLIVGFHTGIPQDVAEKVNAHGAAVLSKNTDINFVVVDPQGRDPDKLMEQLKKLPRVDYVEYDNIVTALYTPNDPYYSSQWGLPDIFAPDAWGITVGNPNVIIAIVDTGVDYKHPDIAANYVAGGKNWINPRKSPMDDNGHGTHVAGIAAAVANNGIGVAGLSQSKIMAEKVLNAAGSGSYSAVANGITHAANNGANIISMSLGGGSSSTTLENAVNFAWGKGSLIVAAAGNDYCGAVSYPAAYTNVIAVAALNQDDTRASYSNCGAKVELAAPGTDIYSTYYKNRYTYMSGTSMATPFVSGSAALVWSKNSGLTNQDVRNILDSSAIDLGASGRDTSFGYGKVNVNGALLITP